MGEAYKKSSKIKTYRRILPVEAYDKEGIMLYLEAMAEKGYCVKEDGFYGRQVHFYKGDSSTVMKYRLQAKDFKIVHGSNGEAIPHGETHMKAESTDWRLLGENRYYRLYSSKGAADYDIKSDEALETEILKKARKLTLIGIIMMLLCVLFALIITDSFALPIGVERHEILDLVRIAIIMIMVIYGVLWYIIRFYQVQKKIKNPNYRLHKHKQSAAVRCFYLLIWPWIVPLLLIVVMLPL